MALQVILDSEFFFDLGEADTPVLGRHMKRT